MRKLLRTTLLLFTTSALVVGLLWLTGTPTPTLLAATCPFVDNDGNDGNPAVGTYQLNTNFTVLAAATAYDCTSAAGITIFIVPNLIVLTLDGNPANGEIAQMNFTNLTVNSGGTISSNLQGCTGDTGQGNGPNSSNVCIDNGGLGTVPNPYTGGGGGGHGGVGGAGGHPNGSAGGVYGSATAPDKFGMSGAGGLIGGREGGTGGGVVRLSVAGTFTHDGTVSANGGVANSASNGGGGGGAGGSIRVTAVTMSGTSGVFNAAGGNGGAGGGDTGGGGGGGGRIAIEYQNGTFSFLSGGFGVSGGAGGAASSLPGNPGAKGTVYVVDTQGTGPTTDDDVRIFHGFTYGDVDHDVNSWTFDAGATSQHCQTGISSSATPSITSAGTMTFNGAFVCGQTIVSFTLSSSSGDIAFAASSSFSSGGALIVTSVPTLTIGAGATVASAGAMTMTASTAFSVGTGAVVTNTAVNTDINFNIPAGNDQTWTNVTINGAREGDLVIDDAIAITLAGTTAVNTNVQWTSLTALTIDATATVNANAKGCTGDSGHGNGPNGSNVCVNDGGSGIAAQQFSAGGGGGHGGAGGLGRPTSGTGGGTYGSATVTALFGASGAGGIGGAPAGGHGGGNVRLNVTGAATINGTISANGGNGASAGSDNGGGGAGGSVFLTAATINGTTGAFQARGGVGGSGSFGGGGGGGGRVSVTRAAGSFSFDASDFDMAGGAGGTGSTTTGVTGSKGTVYLRNTATSRVDIFHGFTYPDTDFSETTWVTDPSATNQYCDVLIAGSATPSITAQTLTFGGTLNCSPSISSFTLLASGGPAVLTMSNNASFTVNAAITLDGNTNVDIGSGVTIVGTKNNTDIVFDIPAGDDQTWTNVAITSANDGDLVMDDSITLTLSGTTVINANVLLTALANLTINTGTSITANTRGCAGDSGHGNNPNGSNVCVNDGGSGTPAQQYSAGGGGGHGGVGGMGRPPNGTGGSVYGSATAPVLYGGSGAGGIGGGIGGAGGGVIRVVISGTFTNNGTVTASAGNGTSGGSDNGGGGAGGSIYVTTGTYTCASAPTWSASGGTGASGTFGGGGGGGGRIRIEYATDSCGSQPLTGLSAAGVAPGGAGGTGSSTSGVAGSAGSLSLFATNPPPVVTVVSHSPASPFTTDPVTLSGTATDNAGVSKIEIYLDGTAPGNLKHTCTFAPAQTPASCSINVGQLSGGSHTTTIKAYDDILQVGQGTENFSVGGSTLSGQLIFSRSKVGVSSSFTLSFALSGTSTGTLTVTFPVQFTVTAGGNSGASSACLSSFGFTSTTMTATKTNCSGTVVLGGATVTNPATPGQYIITWTNDSGSGSVFIVSDDQVFVNATVDPVLTFNVGAQASATACAGSFAGNGGTVPLGALTTGAVASSDAASIPHICSRLTTNAIGGATVTVRSLNASLKSTSVPADAIPSNTTTLTAGTAGYGLCAGSAGADSGMDVTTPAGTTPTRSAPFAGSCTSTTHEVGAMTTSAQNIWTVSGPTQNAFMRVYVKAAISTSTPAHSDYTDTLTFVVTGTY